MNEYYCKVATNLLGMKIPDNLQELPSLIIDKLWCSLYADELFPDDPVPRCGWKTLSTDWIFGFFGKEDPFLDCCRIHDIEYKLKRKPRSQVDKELLQCMKIIAGYNPALYGLALTYYSIVRTTGGFFW